MDFEFIICTVAATHQFMVRTDLHTTRLAIRKLKRFLEFVAYGLFDGLVLAIVPKSTRSEHRAAVVRLNLLGDYFLWLPYGLALIRHLHDQNHQVVLVCNQAWAELAARHFPEAEVFPIDRRRFVKDWLYRARILKTLRGFGVAETHHPTCPRDFIVEDAAVRALGAKASGFDSVFPDRPWVDRAVADRYYRVLVPLLDRAHQSVRHRAYLSHAGVPEHLLAMPLRLPKTASESPSGATYYVIAPGASRRDRRWPVECFAELAKRIQEKWPNRLCVVIGTMEERVLGERIIDALEGQGQNLAGRTGLLELVYWISHARFVVGNDSAAAHIAAAYDVPSVAVIGGGHFGRCFPYDSREARVETLPLSVFHPMECYGCDWICRYRTRPNGCFPCLDAVTVDMVWQTVQELPLMKPM